MVSDIELKKPVEQMTDDEKTAHIQKVVLQAGQDLREKYPLLKNQDAIGASIMIFSLMGMVGTGYLYYLDMISAWLCVPIIAIFASFIHELEHDLIHSMYFRKKPWVNKLMLLVGWIVRPSTVSPFVRRYYHLHHHKYSGTESDIEERGITNGEKWGLRRLLMTGDNMLAVYLRPVSSYLMAREYVRMQKPQNKKEIDQLRRQSLHAYFPIGSLYYLGWHSFVVFYVVNFAASAMGTPLPLTENQQGMVDILNFFAVVLFFPSFLRTFCLHFISSNMHYYGDVEAKNVMQQTQVLNPWWLMPFQLFCFNFGSTHAIHHFVVKEPFYVRQMTAGTAHKVMKEMGVRFNDFGTFIRANRFTISTSNQPSLATQPEKA